MPQPTVLLLSRYAHDDPADAEMSATLPVEFAPRPINESAVDWRSIVSRTLLAPIAVTVAPANVETSPDRAGIWVDASDPLMSANAGWAHPKLPLVERVRNQLLVEQPRAVL